MRATPLRIFQCTAYLWLAVYVLAILILGNAAWTNAPVDLFVSNNALSGAINHLLHVLPPWMIMVFCAVIVVASFLLLKRHDLWLGLLVWLLFRIVTHRTWLASNGGVQLMQNMLLWVALIRADMVGNGGDVSQPRAFVHVFAFWAARLQLLLVYAAAAAHKFTGTSWLDGTAVMRVAGDPLFHLGWLTDFPLVCTVLTYLALAWMTLFPFAVWWRPTRRIWLITGALFHLATAVFMGIPQMGLAFIVCYIVWIQPGDFAFKGPTSPPLHT